MLSHIRHKWLILYDKNLDRCEITFLISNNVDLSFIVLILQLLESLNPTILGYLQYLCPFVLKVYKGVGSDLFLIGRLQRVLRDAHTSWAPTSGTQGLTH